MLHRSFFAIMPCSDIMFIPMASAAVKASADVTAACNLSPTLEIAGWQGEVLPSMPPAPGFALRYVSLWK